ncbi:MAG TPA: hypothetical protein VJ673_13930 [Aromatoleum sp.]|uniref:hypothetical protein n=1 Tax=Aromatoleum sp. TaxID=2307007 RepID=UPI002B48499F|nr:hypothetical protein [Aromatoleum sp.]HJV26782.1 hypothetical protein [Aromatoleum sp.]
MKSVLTILALSLAAAWPAWAEDAHHPDTAAAGAAVTPAFVAAPEKTVQKMRDNAAKMQSQLDALAAAKTPEERQRLLMEHMETMRENMMLGHQMAGGEGGPMSCDMMGGTGMMHGGGMMMGREAAGTSPGAMAERMHQMEKRMDMMQMMMERMAKPAGKAAVK